VELKIITPVSDIVYLQKMLLLCKQIRTVMKL
jgi:hypothetical protein